MKNTLLVIAVILGFASIAVSQNVAVEGYAFEDGGRGYLNQVKVNIYDNTSGSFIEQLSTDETGFFASKLPKDMEFRIEAHKDIFTTTKLVFSTQGKDKVFLEVVMHRDDGYLFDITLAPKRSSEEVIVDAITGSLIEVYNNTTQKEVYVSESHPSPNFSVQFEKGNHYTIMVRKKGYLVKRMEAFVNVDGCILCFEGVGDIKPGVTDNLTDNLRTGTFLANVELDPVYEGKVIEIANIKYEFGKADLNVKAKEELRKLATVMQDNAYLNVELGSHTDVRGTSADNFDLSERRAKSVVDYLTKHLKVRKDRILAHGYGETVIKNKCKSGVDCTDPEHAENRRTEIKILSFDQELLLLKSLASMKAEEEFIKRVVAGDVEQVENRAKGKGAKSMQDGEKGENSAAENAYEIEAEKEMAEVAVEKETMLPEEVVEKVVSEANVIERSEREQVEGKKVGEGETITRNVETEVQEEASEGYSGFRVVIQFSTFPLPSGHKIFSKYDDVTVFETKETYKLYMIGDFKSESNAEAFRKEEVVSEFPGSYVVHFINGEKIKVR